MHFSLPRKFFVTILFLILSFLCFSTVGFAEESSSKAEDETSVVKIGIWVADIDSIDSAAQSFVASVFIRLRWTDRSLAHDDDSVRTFPIDKVWSPELQIVNEIGRVRKTQPEVVAVTNDGTVSYRQRYVGSFSQPLKLHDFPFDEQTFTLHFVSPQEGRTIKFIEDEELAASGLVNAAGISEAISLPDWEVLSYSAGPRPYVLIKDLKEEGYVFEFKARRDSRYFVFKVITPLVLIVFMSWAVFWINPEEAGTQIGVSTASMLTLIAYRFMVGNLVPKVSYMTRLDEYIMGSTVLVFFCLLQVLLTSTLVQRGKKALSLKIDLYCRFIFPALFVGVLFLAFS